jgi:hypothetical protein
MVARVVETDAMVDLVDGVGDFAADVGGNVGQISNRDIRVTLCRRHGDPLPGHTADTTTNQRPPIIRTPELNNDIADDGNQAPVNMGPRRRAQR